MTTTITGRKPVRALAVGDVFLRNDMVICTGDRPERPCVCPAPHPGGASIQVRPVTVLRPAEPHRGRPGRIRVWCRDDRTGWESHISLDLDGAVPTELAPPYLVPAPPPGTQYAVRYGFHRDGVRIRTLTEPFSRLSLAQANARYRLHLGWDHAVVLPVETLPDL